MSENAKNISIEITDGKVYPEPETKSTIYPTIKMTKEEMDGFVQKMTTILQTNEAPVSLCASMIHFQYTQNPVFFVANADNINDRPHWQPINNAIENKLNIEIILHPRCMCGQNSCSRTFMTGACIDPLVQQIGETFFPYAYKEFRQRG